MTNTESDNSRQWDSQAYALLKKRQEEQKQELQRAEEQKQELQRAEEQNFSESVKTLSLIHI